LLGDRLDDDEIELACDAVIGLAGLQRSVQSSGLNRHLHAIDRARSRNDFSVVAT
jgi:hypothetical protein